jgi:hypothetical protein
VGDCAFDAKSALSMEFEGAEDDIAAGEVVVEARKVGEEESGRDGAGGCATDPSLYSMISSGREETRRRRRVRLLMLRMVNVRTVGEFTITLSKSRPGSEKGVSMW